MELQFNLEKLLALVAGNAADLNVNISVAGKVLVHIEFDPRQFEDALGVTLPSGQ